MIRIDRLFFSRDIYTRKKEDEDWQIKHKKHDGRMWSVSRKDFQSVSKLHLYADQYP